MSQLCPACRRPMMSSAGEALMGGLLSFGVDVFVHGRSTFESGQFARHVLATGLCTSCSCRTFQPAPEPRQLPQDGPNGQGAPGRRAPRKRPLGGRPKRSRRRPK